MVVLASYVPTDTQRVKAFERKAQEFLDGTFVTHAQA